jgi:hypothetical protein
LRWAFPFPDGTGTSSSWPGVALGGGVIVLPFELARQALASVDDIDGIKPLFDILVVIHRIHLGTHKIRALSIDEGVQLLAILIKIEIPLRVLVHSLLPYYLLGDSCVCCVYVHGSRHLGLLLIFNGPHYVSSICLCPADVFGNLSHCQIVAIGLSVIGTIKQKTLAIVTSSFKL